MGVVEQRRSSRGNERVRHFDVLGQNGGLKFQFFNPGSRLPGRARAPGLFSRGEAHGAGFSRRAESKADGLSLIHI